MLSATLSHAARSPRARHAVEALPLTRAVVDRFVAGERTTDAVAAASELAAVGRSVTIDVLGEGVHDVAGARRTRDAYLALLGALAEAGLARGADASVKLSALGQAIPGVGEAFVVEQAEEVCAAARAVGATVTLDMEDHTTVDSTLSVGETLRRTDPTVGNVLQSNLLRTPGDIAALARGGAGGTRVRLVKGAYKEPAGVAHQRKRDVDAAYRDDVAALLGSRCYAMIATHDPVMLTHAVGVAEREGRTADAWELQMLYGIRTDLQQGATDAGHRMRVYVPFGTDWYGYFMRRLAERPANVAFFLRALAHR
ncbi:proline dehydrogenase family protein [Nocardioides sp. TRM66260-LWL]|uniref:proline dehydrogenase family protein n=1 Tax=Nocardioides sp. TRM66260-LWL TaxID=2874478 RepID=UPI001CC7DB81|nr:proline dehydrogenase family protein [Nocardioides sp. TRM66260-LWL]MBZ5735413.1 proline dehydrogenase family protein [Nocardioides sp. TRM66260-LWL]